MATLRINIVSLEAEIFCGDAARVTVPAAQGDMGILPRHAPLLARLRAGQVRVHDESGAEQWIYISGGMLEVQPFEVTVLADVGVRSKHADQASADEARRLVEEAARNAPMFGSADRAYAELVASITESLELNRAHRAEVQRLHRKLRRD